MFVSVKSLGENKCFEVCINDFGWSWIFPTKSGSKVHKTLSKVFHRNKLIKISYTSDQKHYRRTTVKCHG
jgi:hypothetical protein